MKRFHKVNFNSFSIRIWGKENFILWETAWNYNEIDLRKWYYKSSLYPKKAIKLSNWCIKYFDGFSYNMIDRLIFDLNKVESINFKCLLVDLSYNNFKKWSNQFYFNQKNIQFDFGILESAIYKTQRNSQLYFIDQNIKVENEYRAKIKYFQREHLISLKITNKPLSNDDIKNLILKIEKIGNIKMLSLLVSDPSSIIDILNWSKQTHPITSITLEVTASFSLAQNHKIRNMVNQLKFQGKRVLVYGLNKSLKNF